MAAAAAIGIGAVVLQKAAPVDNAAAASGDVVIAAAGDIANCNQSGDEATAQLLDSIAPTAVLTLGDNAYPDGSDANFTSCYDPNWGRQKAKTYPAPGNHDYHVAGAAGYFNYFGAAAGEPAKGYYSVDLGGWHLISLNSNCSVIGGCGAGSPQEQWLRADLAAHTTSCTLAYWHHPRFSSGAVHGSNPNLQAFWEALYAYGADVVLSGHDHDYERFAPQSPDAVADPAQGIREFVVGTGGTSHYSFNAPLPNSEVRNSDSFGVLELMLRPTGYDWQFVPVSGATFTDSGSGSCVTGAPDNQAPAVDAGPDQMITLPASTSLDGTVSDDHQPNPPDTVTTTWSKTSGPGTVTFGDPSAVDTTASFSQSGIYVLRLTATDSALQSFDELTITVDAASGGDLIFADGFESGSFSAWSSVRTGGGDLSATPAAALVGAYGMQARIDDNTSLSVTDTSPSSEPNYRAGFHFDPNSISMATGNAHFICDGRNAAHTRVLRVEFRLSGTQYQIRAALLRDTTSFANTAWVTITDASHPIEIAWRASTAPGANSGSLALSIDGVQEAALAGVDNDTRRVDEVRLGAVGGLDTRTRGVYFFDAFDSRR